MERRGTPRRTPASDSRALTGLRELSNYAVEAILANQRERQHEADNAALARRCSHLEEVLANKSSRVSTLGRELYTPLTAISGFCDVLAEGLGGELTAEQRDDVDCIRSSTDTMIAMVAELLELAQTEAAQPQLEVVPGRVARTTAA
jgi:signal transduction histidine kinase